MNENEKKYAEWSKTLDLFLKQTHEYVDHLMEQRKRCEKIKEEAENFKKLCWTISCEFGTIRWAVHDIQTGNHFDLINLDCDDEGNPNNDDKEDEDET